MAALISAFPTTIDGGGNPQTNRGPMLVLMEPSSPPPAGDELDNASIISAAGSDSDDKGGDSPSAVRVLQARSRLAQSMKDVPRFKSILIIEDNPRDGDRMVSTLRTMFGYDIRIRQARTLGTALDAVLDEQPELILLDDRLGPVDKAETSIPFLRTAKCTGIIIVISSFVDRRRRADLIKLGAVEAIDKDDLDSTTISKALINAFTRSDGDPSGTSRSPDDKGP